MLITFFFLVLNQFRVRTYNFHYLLGMYKFGEIYHSCKEILKGSGGAKERCPTMYSQEIYVFEISESFRKNSFLLKSLQMHTKTTIISEKIFAQIFVYIRKCWCMYSMALPRKVRFQPYEEYKVRRKNKVIHIWGNCFSHMLILRPVIIPNNFSCLTVCKY